MRELTIILIFLVIAQACNSQPQTKEKSGNSVITCKEDSLKIIQLFAEFHPAKDLATGELIVKIGQSLLGTPYVSHTLEVGDKEPLVVTLHELDCTTFDETCLAAALTVKAGKTDFASYAQTLEKIRYRNGVRQGYLSRLHYFSDWLYDNMQKGFISPLGSSFQQPWRKTINFMSTHPDSYEQLKGQPDLVKSTAQQEQQISAQTMYYLPKTDLTQNEKELQNGDIIGITTSVAGLDIAHVGFVIWVDGRVHLLHASSSLEKVVISDEPLADYLAGKKSFTGVMIARPK